MRDLVVHNVNSNMPKEHKAVMKTDVAEHFIGKFTNENDIILDCFFGHGTTGKKKNHIMKCQLSGVVCSITTNSSIDATKKLIKK
jgi:NAD(P)H-hydrate repair Nnr-like enzyme with NAD(P)H-hydrate epimerase domain